jgi:uncharacterized protein
VTRVLPAPFLLGGEAVKAGESAQIRLRLSESYGSTSIYMPVTVIHGALPGPAVFFSAAVHGDEINGVEIVRQLTYQLDAATLRGTVVCVPVVNVPGFNTQSRYLPDGRDLNRMFPGDPQGSQSSRIANLVFDEVVSRCQFGVDFHTGSGGRLNMPHIRCDADVEDCRRLAKAFGTRVILHGKGQKGSLRREALRKEIPTLTFEAGEAGRFEQRSVRIGVEGSLGVLGELRMLETAPVHPNYQVIARKGEWIRADRGGIADLQVKPGDLVYAGNRVASVSNPYGSVETLVSAPFTGLVVGISVNPLVTPGSPLCHLVKLDKTLSRVEHALAHPAANVS